MIVIIPDSVQRDKKTRFFKHLNENNLEFVFDGSDVDETFTPRWHYVLPEATVNDALVLKLKFPDCIIHHFAL